MKKLLVALAMLTSTPAMAASGVVGLPIGNEWVSIEPQRCSAGIYRGKETLFVYPVWADLNRFIWTSDQSQIAMMAKRCGQQFPIFLVKNTGSNIYVMMNVELE